MVTDASLTADDLAGMRSTLESSLPDTATVQRDTEVSDGAGGWTVTTAASAPVACRIAPSGGREAVVAGKLDAVSTWTVTLPWGTDVTARDRIAIGSRTLEVAVVLGDRTWELGRRVLCTEVL